MTTTKDLEQFTGYDLTVAKAQLYNYGQIFLDEYGCPVDDFEEIDEYLRGEREND